MRTAPAALGLKRVTEKKESSGFVVGGKNQAALRVPDVVEPYRLYEGTGTPYRADPRDVLAALDLLKPTR